MSKKSSNFAAQNVCIMKKFVLFIASALLLAGCQQSSNIASTIAQSQPIMPIRMQSESAHVVLTDYVPVLFGNTDLWEGLQWTTDESIDCTNLIGSAPMIYEMDITNRDRSIHAIAFQDKSGSFAIPILPAKPVRQAFLSLGYADDQLQVGFVHAVSNPNFAAYIQNMPVNHQRWQANEDGTWTLDLAGLDYAGRTYLRIFAVIPAISPP